MNEYRIFQTKPHLFLVQKKWWFCWWSVGWCSSEDSARSLVRGMKKEDDFQKKVIEL